MNNEERVTYFAETDARNKRLKFGIKAKDRTRHVYVIGKTGMGKSTLLENMAVQDIQNGEGMAFIDPHGKTADLLMEYIPKERIRDVIVIAPFDTDYPISFNVLESVDPAKRHLVVSGLMSTFKKIWVDAWSARMEYILTNTLLALLEAPGSTLLGVNKMLSDKTYRNEVISHITDPSVKTFWVKEFAGYTERMAAEAVPAIQNKVGQFTANPLIRNMIGQPNSSFDFREAMDKKKIMIINLSKGRIGDENMKLLGGLLVTKLYLAAMSRADVPDRVMKMLPNFYLFVDEFQNFANASFADILSEARKYKLNLTIAHQYIEQMDEIVRPAVFGNVGTMITFRVGANDAEALEKEFAPQFTIEDLVNLGFAQIYMKLMINGLSSAPFSAVTLPPIPHPDQSFVQDIIAASREQYARPRAQVEEQIIKFHEGAPKPAPKVAGNTSSFAKASDDKQSPISTTQTPVAPVVRDGVIRPTFSPGVTPEMVMGTHASDQPKSAQVSKDAPQSNGTSSHSATPKQKQEQTHKPFSGLKDILATVTKKEEKPPAPVMPPKYEPVAVDTKKPLSHTEPKPEVKPVPLSTLTPKSQKVDPKAQSPKNVADLKNALLSAMVKGGGSEKKPNDPVHRYDAENTKTTMPVVDLEKLPQRPPTPPSQAAQDTSYIEFTPKEVPQDILQKVLKVD